MAEDEKIIVSEEDFRKRFVYDPSGWLGEGGFAKVYKAHDRQFDETVALKFYTKTDVQKYDIITEMRNSRRFTHQNVIRVYDARIVRFTNSFGVTEDVQVGILEYANGGNLLDFLDQTPSEAEFKKVMTSILWGLHYLHTEMRVIHRDLSPDNILMMRDSDQWIPKIADFGISKQIDLKTINLGGSGSSSELIGKMEYMAPEQFDPQKYGIDGRITTNVDLWSFGVILAEIFLETTPFGDRNTAQNPMQIVQNVLQNPLPSEIRSVPEPYQRVIRRCLVKDAKKRVQHSGELIRMLSDASPVAPNKKKSKAGIVWGITLLLVALVGGGAWYYFQLRADALPTPTPGSLGNTSPQDTAGQSQLPPTEPQLDKAVASLRKTNLFLLIDATPGMEGQLPHIANAVRQLIGATQAAVGAACYRDAVEGAWLYMDASARDDIPRWIQQLNTDVQYDQDEPEAVYYGLQRAVQSPIFRENETNVLVLLGDAGNHAQEDITQVDIDELRASLVQKNIHFAAVQVRNPGGEAYELFGNQLLEDFLLPLVSDISQVQDSTIEQGLLYRTDTSPSYWLVTCQPQKAISPEALSELLMNYIAAVQSSVAYQSHVKSEVYASRPDR